MQKVQRLNTILGTAFGFITPDYLGPLLEKQVLISILLLMIMRNFYLYNFRFENVKMKVMKLKKLEINSDI
ncbi:hypothetical protein FIV31_04605 [Coxiella endosymbiont of Ornithodoros amblus]|uniref:hypothetical protein n=1 Tax=Coxiella endosymbiont of Ornithodoros amblus TaxID=1656166 RepID=UPI00244E21B0|nr:hypothetical protein [Coxiella endosymbiont of Ornithodoros amblus]MBW5802773.1 hypothetical protein [Coxiella endosymbiont of Ornithodoros amblus]